MEQLHKFQSSRPTLYSSIKPIWYRKVLAWAEKEPLELPAHNRRGQAPRESSIIKYHFMANKYRCSGGRAKSKSYEVLYRKLRPNRKSKRHPDFDRLLQKLPKRAQRRWNPWQRNPGRQALRFQDQPFRKRQKIKNIIRGVPRYVPGLQGVDRNINGLSNRVVLVRARRDYGHSHFCDGKGCSWRWESVWGWAVRCAYCYERFENKMQLRNGSKNNIIIYETTSFVRILKYYLNF